MKNVQAPLAFTAVMLTVLSVPSCGGGGSSSVPSGSSLSARQTSQKGAYTLDELVVTDSGRANPHHTVYAAVHHPASAQPEKSKVAVPYHFDFPTSQRVCIEAGDYPGHAVEVRDSAGNVMAVLTDANPCQQIEFAPGDYDLEVQHGGQGEVDEALHVFAHSRFSTPAPNSRFGKVLTTVESAPRAQQALRAGGNCTALENVTFTSLSQGTPLIVESAYQVGNFEFYSTGTEVLAAEPQIIGTELLPPHAVVLTIYDCGDGTWKFGRNSGSQFLQARCGYLFLSAKTLDDATAFYPIWDSVLQRFDLQNAATGAVAQLVQRGAGKVVSTGKHPAMMRPHPQLGTCSNFPSDLTNQIGYFRFNPAGRGLPFTVFTPITEYFTLMEFQYTAQGTYSFNVPNDATVTSYPLSPHNNYAGKQTFDRYQVGKYTTFNSLSDRLQGGGLALHHQDALVFSFGKCERCDLSGIDLSNRQFRTLTLDGSSLINANLSGLVAGGISLDGATIKNSDFTSARFGGASFERTQMDSVIFSETQFGQASLGLPPSFHGATISNTHFTSVDLSSADFTGTTLTHCTFTDANLTSTDFSNSSISQTDIRSASGRAAMVKQTNFTGSVIDTMTIGSAEATGINFTNAHATRLELANANAANGVFRGVRLTGSTLNGSFLVGSDFSQSVLEGSSFDGVDAYSSGSTTTMFDDCTVIGGNFVNSKFMQSSFANCKLRGGSFGNSEFVSCIFHNVESEVDQTGIALSFENALLAGAEFDGASLDGADLTNAILSTKNGSVDITIRTSPTESITRSYNYDPTTRPATTSAATICPNGSLGPCSTDAQWLPVNPPNYEGHEDPDSW